MGEEYQIYDHGIFANIFLALLECALASLSIAKDAGDTVIRKPLIIALCTAYIIRACIFGIYFIANARTCNCEQGQKDFRMRFAPMLANWILFPIAIGYCIGVVADVLLHFSFHTICMFVTGVHALFFSYLAIQHSFCRPPAEDNAESLFGTMYQVRISRSLLQKIKGVTFTHECVVCQKVVTDCADGIVIGYLELYHKACMTLPKAAKAVEEAPTDGESMKSSPYFAEAPLTTVSDAV